MRHVEQPGPAGPERIQWIEARGMPIVLPLRKGRLLLHAVRDACAAHGVASACIDLGGLVLKPFGYVMPALSPTPDHAAFYSLPVRPEAGATIECGRMTFGERDGAPFFHAHALWTEGDGRRAGGHILPDETVLAADDAVPATVLADALFRAEYDPETRFTLFVPTADTRSRPLPDGERRMFPVRLRPNQDITEALEGFCRNRGLQGATIRGGVGSLVGARFTDGREVEPFATEVAITGGAIDAEAAGSWIEVALVDDSGALARGRLARGENAVLMTFELVLEG